MGRYTPAEAQILAERAYPNGASGLCSHLHHGPGESVHCTICFPDVWALIEAHNRLKHLAWDRLRELGEALPGVAALGDQNPSEEEG